MKFSDFRVGDYVVFERVLSEQDFRLFAELSGDRNGLHHDPAAAERLGFARPIAPHYLTIQPFSAIAGMALPGPPCLILSQETQALRPVHYGERITFSARICQVGTGSRTLALSLLVLRGAEVAVSGSMQLKCVLDEWNTPADQPLQMMKAPSAVAITGATGSIGSATVRAMLSRGWKVVPICRTAPSAEVLRSWGAERDNAGILENAILGDLTEPADLVRIAEEIARAEPAVVIHTASSRPGDKLEALIATNYGALSAITAVIVPGLLARQQGRLIALGSSAQLTHPPGFDDYAAAKAMAAHHLRGVHHRYCRFGTTSALLLPIRVENSFSADLASGDVALEPEQVAESLADLAEADVLEDNVFVLDLTGLRPVRSSPPLPEDSSPGRTAASAPLLTVYRGADLNPEPGGSAIRKRLRDAFSRAVPQSSRFAAEEIRFGEVPGWDSLQHIQLLLEIERAFPVSLSATDFSRATSFEEIEAFILNEIRADRR